MDASVLRVNAAALFTAGKLVAAIEPILEPAALTLDDIDVRTPLGVTVSRSWMVQVRWRDSRAAARWAAMVIGVLRDGNGWKRVGVVCASGESVPMHIVPDKTRTRAEKWSARRSWGNE